MKKRKILFLAAVLASAAVFSACAMTKSDVRLISEEQAKEMAAKNTSTWEYKGCLKDKKNNVVTYNFTDTEMGFDFAVISRATGRGLDGATFYYDDNTYCDWEMYYSEIVYNNCKTELEDICKAKGLVGAVVEKPFSLSVVITDGSAAEDYIDVYPELCSCIEKADVKGKFKDMEIRIANLEGEGHRLGFYTAAGGYISADDKLTGEMTADAEKRTGSDVKVISTKKCGFDELKSEISLSGYNSVPEVPMWDDAWEKFMVLELESNGKRYKMANVEVDGAAYLADENGDRVPPAKETEK